MAQKNAPKNGLATNDGFIKGIYNTLDLNDSKEVFRYVFSRLDNEVVIYPTENYYYFIFPSQGKMVWGSISLDVEERDAGILDIGYIEKIDKSRERETNFQPAGGWGKYSAKDGVVIKKINTFNYSVTFEGKTVIFRLNDVGLAPPKKAQLTTDEIFVGPSFDESGLQFFLIFNKAENHLYWILNEDGFVPESFRSYADDLVIGDRTEFAFYLDKKYNRKILVGAEGLNVLENNWYDGPFDQMPDNYVSTGQIEVKKYIEASYPEVMGRIDKYGNYLDEEGVRVPVAPYLVYFSKQDLISLIESCKSSSSAFYSCLTEQTFYIPEDFYEELNLSMKAPDQTSE